MENNVVSLRSSSDFLGVREIPIVRRAVFFLKRAGAEHGIKITAKGNLGRDFVQEFWHTHIKNDVDHPFKPTREIECPEITRLHFLLTEAKYVRKYKKSIVLTSKGKAELQKNSKAQLYKDLFFADLYTWNWAHEDRYPDYDFIQQTGQGLFLELLRAPEEHVTSEQIFDSLFELPKHSSFELRESETPWSLPEELQRCFNVRFFRRFCLPFGLLEDVSNAGWSWHPNNRFRKTKFLTNDFLKIVCD